MPMENAIVAVYDSPASAALAVEGLKDAGYELDRVSVASRDSGVEEGSACYYKDGAEVRYWGKMGGFWNRLLQVLPGWAFVPVTGVGPVVVAGPLARWVVAALENASIFSGVEPHGGGTLQHRNLAGRDRGVRNGPGARASAWWWRTGRRAKSPGSGSYCGLRAAAARMGGDR